MTTQIGVISNVKLGFGGYQDAMFGLSLSFDFKGSGVNAFISGGWRGKRSEHDNWTDQDRSNQQGVLCMKISELLDQAKVDDVTKLKGKPVECSFNNMELVNWRILEEAIL